MRGFKTEPHALATYQQQHPDVPMRNHRPLPFAACHATVLLTATLDFIAIFLRSSLLHFLQTDFAKAYDLKEEDHLDVEAFEAEAAPLPSEDSAPPKFACTDLVETSCDDPCDWHEACLPRCARFLRGFRGKCEYAASLHEDHRRRRA